MQHSQKNVFLHIGWHKTGTTAIQTFFRKNRAFLLHHSGILYPKTGQLGTAHHRLAHSLLHSNSGNPGLWSELKTELETTHNWKTAVISAESLHGATKEDIDLICLSVLEDWKIHVICYLRQPDEYLESLYAEKVKKGMLFDSWTVYKNKMIEQGEPNYSSSIQLWKKKLGNTAIILRPYDSQQWHQKELISDFLYNIGHSLTSETLNRIPSSRINASPDAYTLSTLQEIARILSENKVAYTAPLFKRFICEPLLNRLKQDTSNHNPARFFSTQERLALRETYQPIFKNLGISFSTNNPPPLENNENGCELPAYAELPFDKREKILLSCITELMSELVSHQGNRIS